MDEEVRIFFWRDNLGYILTTSKGEVRNKGVLMDFFNLARQIQDKLKLYKKGEIK